MALRLRVRTGVVELRDGPRWVSGCGATEITFSAAGAVTRPIAPHEPEWDWTASVARHGRSRDWRFLSFSSSQLGSTAGHCAMPMLRSPTRPRGLSCTALSTACHRVRHWPSPSPQGPEPSARERRAPRIQSIGREETAVVLWTGGPDDGKTIVHPPGGRHFFSPRWPLVRRRQSHRRRPHDIKACLSPKRSGRCKPKGSGSCSPLRPSHQTCACRPTRTPRLRGKYSTNCSRRTA